MITGVHAVIFTTDAEQDRADIDRPVSDQGFGLMTAIRLPGGGELGLYEPRHPIPTAGAFGTRRESLLRKRRDQPWA